MSNNWDYEQSAPPLNDTKVDQLAGLSPGPIDELPTLAIDIPDYQIIKNLESRIQDSVGYWDSPDGYNLRQARGDNMRLYLGKQLDVRSLYRFQIPYIENQIYIAEQAILSYVTAQSPQPEVSPAQDNPRSKIFAIDLEKVCMAHSQKVQLQQLLENAVRNALNKRIGIIYFEFVPDHGENGEIIPKALNPEEVIIDKNARQGENPAFISRQLKMSVNEACNRWPGKKEEIYKECGIIRGTYKQLEEILNIREVWVTYYDKSYEPKEACVYYFGNIVLEKDKNPHWLYATKNKNFLDMPRKPFIPLNFDNDGQHWVDETSAVEQAGNIQNILNKRGRQLMEVADKANGTLVIDTRSGISKSDSQDLTGDPNQHIVIAGLPGVNSQDLIFRLDPPEIPDFLMQDKIDQRTTIHAIMGTPSEFTGSNDGDDDSETLGQSIMKKDQASGRQDLYVRAIDRFMNQYFNFLIQMMVVWYNEKHFFVYNGGDGEFDYLTISRDLIEDGIAVNVKSGTSLPFDKQRQEAIVLQLLKMDASISLLDAYKLLHMQNPQQLYDNWAKQKTDPMALARDALDEMDEAKAFIAYAEFRGGKTPKDPEDPSKEFVLSLRKQMLSDEFLNIKKPWTRANHAAFIKYVDKAITSLELRTSLDLMSKEGIQMLEPDQPIQPLPPPMPPMQPGMGMPGQPMQPPGMMPPGGIPGQPTVGALPQAAPPPMGAPMGMPPQLPNPQQPAMPPPPGVGGIPPVL
jgi:hypothetical protein